MAVKFKVKRFKGGNTPQEGKYYARAAMVGKMDIFDIAEAIQRNSSMKRGDVVGVLLELVEVMKDALQDSIKVRLNGLGTFKIAVTGKLVDTPDEVTAKNIQNFRILFTPEYKRDPARKHKVRLLKGAKAEPLAEYKAGINDKDSTTGV